MLLCLPIFIVIFFFFFSVVAVEVGNLRNHVNYYVHYVCLLFNFRLFAVIDLSSGVLFAQHPENIFDSQSK